MADQGEGAGFEGGAGEGAGGEGGGQAPAGPDFAPVMERFDGLAQQFSEFTGRIGALEQRIPAQEPEEPEAPGFTYEDLMAELPEESFADDGQSLTVEGLLELSRRQAEQMLASREQASAQTALEQRREKEMVALEDEFPRLSDQAVADEVADFAIATAIGVCEGTGRNPADLAMEPRFVRQMYLAYEAQKAQASGRVPGSDPSVPVERPGGAGPAQEQGPSDADRIVAISQRGKFRLGT